MKISEIAKEFETTNQVVLNKLKALKLKAKGKDQELNKAVAMVLRSELAKEFKKSKGAAKPKKTAVSTGASFEKEGETSVKGKEKQAKDEKPPVPKKRVVKKKTASAGEPTEALAVKKKTAARKTAVEKTAASQAKASAEDKPSAKATKPTKTSKPALKPVASARPSARGAAPATPTAASISDAPFIPLKPLSKRRKRPSGKTTESSKTSRTKSAAETPISTTPAQPAGFPTSVDAVEESDLKELEVKVPITVKDLAAKLNRKTSEVLKQLMGMGIFAHLNLALDEDIVERLARAFGYRAVQAKTEEEAIIDQHLKEEEAPENLVSRSPVVTFMGHVDHGKTSLLDRIRKSRIADAEHGGITQHIGAYRVSLPKGMITFLDTPGHEAFTAMRARGAHITDLVVLVIAADEGIMPQTEEAIDHARAADVPILVALNKMDRKGADPDRVKKQLQERDLTPEDWGGKTVCVGVSAVTGEGVDDLLEMILLEAEMLELRANPQKRASGIVVEAHLSRGRGAVASLIVQSGTLRRNDILVVGPVYGKIKAMFNDRGEPVTEAGPSSPVEILGLPDVPEAGEMFYVVEGEKQAREITDLRRQRLQEKKLGQAKRVSLEDLYSQIQEGRIKELNVILKADVQGSLEALRDALEKIPSDEVKVRFIHTGVGDVNASDVILAQASNAIVIAFHVGIGPRAKEELDKNPVDVREYRIIYDAVNDMKKALEGLLAPKEKRVFVGRVEVRQVFKLSRAGVVAGCFVLKGKAHRKAKVDVMRNGEVVYSGQIGSVKRFKDDVREVAEGFECGITIDGFDKYEPGDILEVYELETVTRTL